MKLESTTLGLLKAKALIKIEIHNLSLKYLKLIITLRI